jgi:hypothetical protein
MGVVGFAANIVSLLKLADSLLLNPVVEHKPLTYLLTYKFSQDHWEILFSCIRKSFGFNNNPTVTQFESVMKKLLFRSGVSLLPSDNANITALDDTSLVSVSHCNTGNFHTGDYSQAPVAYFEDTIIDETYATVLDRLSPFVDNILVYIAGWVVRCVCKRLSCVDCLDVLVSDNLQLQNNCLLTIKNNGGLVCPSADVLLVLRAAEAALRSFTDVTGTSRVTASDLGQILEMRVMKRLPSNLFSSAYQHFTNLSHGCESHCWLLIRKNL